MARACLSPRQTEALIIESVVTIHSDPKLFCKLGALCESLNPREEARVWYQLAIERDPLDGDAQQGLSHVRKTGVDPGAPGSFPMMARFQIPPR